MPKQNGGFSALAKLKAGRRPIHKTAFPGSDQEVGLRLPTEADWEEARLGAMKHFMAHDIDISRTVDAGGTVHEPPGARLFEREVLTRLLASCLIIPTDSNVQPPFCDGVEDLKRHATPAERAALQQELLDFASEWDPDLSTAEGVAAAAAMLEELEKKAPSEAALRLALKGFAPAMLRRCLLTLVVQRSTSASERSSSTSDG